MLNAAYIYIYICFLFRAGGPSRPERGLISLSLRLASRRGKKKGLSLLSRDKSACQGLNRSGDGGGQPTLMLAPDLSFDC